MSSGPRGRLSEQVAFSGDQERALRLARAGDEAAFRALVEPHRRELHVHCYRMLGSVDDAEDLVQETLMNAWRGLGRFEGRSSLRRWLYRIATNACVSGLRRERLRTPDITPAEPPSGDPPPPTPVDEPVWLEPYPDALLEGVTDVSADPACRYSGREAIQLAFITALQRLPARQRAVLVLRDVLAFRASEVAEMLETTEASVTSALQRARAAVDERIEGHEPAPLPSSPREREIVARFADAFEAGDIPAIVELLSDDALLTMPPEPYQFTGADEIGRFFATVPAGGRLDRIRLVHTRANSQPALAAYLRDQGDGRLHAYGIMVLTIEGDRIAAITGFPDRSVFRHFGLPRTLHE
jgi:RNA polymerase sigma-70 factor (TIGR02960 family)